MVEETGGAGTQVLKFRGGMPPLGMTRVFAQYRLANAMALLDDSIRGGGAEGSVGARGWDNYSWHTDLPPGHPMVTGQQTVDFDLCNVEHAGLAIVWGMNWITTKMPDSHWLTEARMKGTKVVVISAEYSATACKADEVIVVRPGTTPALALGVAQVMIKEKLYDEDAVRSTTDLPMLVRMDTGGLLRAAEVFPGYEQAALDQQRDPDLGGQAGARHPPPARAGDHRGQTARVGRLRGVGRFARSGGRQPRPDRPALRGARRAPAPRRRGHGPARRRFARSRAARSSTLTRELLDGSYTPEQVEKITWAPAAAIRSLARQIAANPEKTLFVMGMGPNQFFNSDLKDRAIFLIAAMTRNVGRIGGNVGSYAGNYRAGFSTVSASTSPRTRSTSSWTPPNPPARAPTGSRSRSTTSTTATASCAWARRC